MEPEFGLVFGRRKIMVDYLEGIDYNFIEVNGYAGVELLTPPFQDVMYTYSNVHITEADETSEDAVLSFNFDVVNQSNYTPEEFSTVEFKTKIGDILMSILQNSAENTLESEYIDSEES
jgi:hypothetical protein